MTGCMSARWAWTAKDSTRPAARSKCAGGSSSPSELKLNQAKQTRLLLYAGRLSKEKNLLLLPQMLARLTTDARVDYRLVIAGDGPFAADLRASIDVMATGRALFLGHPMRKRKQEPPRHPVMTDSYGAIRSTTGMRFVRPVTAGALIEFALC